jgi:hypothetical protein
LPDWRAAPTFDAVGQPLTQSIAEYPEIGLSNMKRFKFGILPLLVLTAILAIPFAWISWQIYEIRKEKAFIASLEHQSLAMSVEYHDTTDRPVGWLENLLGHREVKHLRVQTLNLAICPRLRSSNISKGCCF